MRAAYWIRFIQEEDGQYVSVTDNGRKFASVLCTYSEGLELPDEDMVNFAGENIGLDDAEIEEYDDIMSKELPTAIIQYRNKSNNLVDEPSLCTENMRLKSLNNGEHLASRMKIMIVEDEPDVALTYEAMLRTEGYTNIEVFHNSEEALWRFASAKPGHYDLLILDIRMNGVNGLQLYQRVKLIDESVRIIFVTALSAIDEVTSILNPRPAAILKKPIEKRKLLKSVSACLEGISTSAVAQGSHFSRPG